MINSPCFLVRSPPSHPFSASFNGAPVGYSGLSSRNRRTSEWWWSRRLAGHVPTSRGPAACILRGWFRLSKWLIGWWLTYPSCYISRDRAPRPQATACWRLESRANERVDLHFNVGAIADMTCPWDSMRCFSKTWAWNVRAESPSKMFNGQSHVRDYKISNIYFRMITIW